MKFQAAYWCASPAMVKDGSDRIAESIHANADAEGVEASPIDFKVMEVGDDDCPPVPAWMPEGADPRLLIGTAVPVRLSLKVTPAGASFIKDLSEGELLHLRKVTQRAATKAGHGKQTDEELDALIAAIGPRAAEAVLANKVRGSIN